MTKRKVALQVTFSPWHGWNKKWRVKIQIPNWVGWMTWYDVSDVTPYGPTGFKTKAEAMKHMKEVDVIFNG